ncbi:hypothetical protein JB92DRAFT_2919913 [Gautieria morchelliformis]|nr:hypothetical protein JB92DRAFT_2919913 [Gautieria morchelliformis]
MADFQLVDPQGWEWDLQSIYSAYMNYFQLHSVPWYDRTWGYLFANLEAFLSFGWPAIVVTDASTGRAHIVTRMTSIGAFIKMIKTRFGESLPVVENMLHITPFETHNRHLRTVSDSTSYKKIHSTLPAATLAAQKVHVRSGEPKWVRDLWRRKDKTFLAIDFEWSERNASRCLEWGYAAVRCGHLDAMGVWPPVPEKNYRKGHFIVADYVDKVHNKHCPTFPWEYAFGESQVIPKAKLGEIVQATISSLASPDSETVPNQLVLVAHGIGGGLERLADLKVKLPNNILIIDTATFERQLFAKGKRGAMIDTHTNKPRAPGTTLSLRKTLYSLNADLGCAWHCSGNDAFGTLLALQLLLQPENTPIPVVRTKRSATHSPTPGFTINPNIGAGYRTLPSRSLSRAGITTPRPGTGDSEDLETHAQGLTQLGSGRPQSPKRGARPLHPPSSFAGGGAASVVTNDATRAGIQGGPATGGRVSKRTSFGPLDVLRLGGFRLSRG